MAKVTPENTIALGSCECGVWGQLFQDGKCAHCTIKVTPEMSALVKTIRANGGERWERLRRRCRALRMIPAKVIRLYGDPATWNE